MPILGSVGRTACALGNCLLFVLFLGFPSWALEVYQIPYQRAAAYSSAPVGQPQAQPQSTSPYLGLPQGQSYSGSTQGQGMPVYRGPSSYPTGGYESQGPPRQLPLQPAPGAYQQLQQPVGQVGPAAGPPYQFGGRSQANGDREPFKGDGLGPLSRSPGAQTQLPGTAQPGTHAKSPTGQGEGPGAFSSTPKEKWEAPPRSESELSAFERYVAQQLSPAVKGSRELRQFGYELFSQGRYPFLSPAEQAMDPSYVIGPDDEILLRIWGKVTGDYSLKVDREGYIHVPGVGDIQVAGVRYGGLKAHLSKEIGKYFSGFDLSARVGSLRSIRVFVVGKVVQPGTYEVSALSTMIHALGAAQGPSKTGSMRDIKLIRAGKVVARLDLYDFLLRGDRTKDMVLQDGDVVFVPFVGPLVGLAGMVKEPAIYELAAERKLSQVITMGGGVSAVGYTPRVQVLRVKDNVYKTVMDVSLKEALEIKDIDMQDGDIVQVFSVDDRVANAVELAGNVVRPGTYAWRQGMRVSDLVSKPEDIQPNTHMEVAMVVRQLLPDYREELISFNLEKAMKGDPVENLLLQPGDRVRVFSKDEFNILPVVRITGAVWRAGEYKLRENMRVSHLVNLAGGLQYFASEWGELTRVRVTQEGPVTEQLKVNLFKALERDPQHDLPLMENDYLFVRAVPDWQLYRQVTLSGEVRHPGVYAVKKGERLSSVIERAGGFTEKAYLKGAVFTRKSAQQVQKKHYEEMIKRLEMEIASVNLESTQVPVDEKEKGTLVTETIRQRRELLNKLKQVEPTGRVAIRLAPMESFKNSQWDLETEDGDHLHIPEVPNTIHVLGAVYNPGAFTYEPGSSVRNYVSKSGGPTPFADTSQIYVLKVNGVAVPPSDASHLVTWNPKANRFEMDQFAGLSLDPGDTIIVPQDVDRVPFLKGLKEVTTVLYQIAVSAGVLFTAIF